MTHKAIKRFSLEGIISDDSAIARLKSIYIKIMTDDMRDQGYVPVLDMAPAFSVSFNEAQKNYDFALTIHGVYYGKKKAREIYGVTDGKEIGVGVS